jgi:phosphohistidine phosphatase
LKELLLLRHAKSSWEDGDRDDFDRALAPRGRRGAKLIGDYLASKTLRLDWVLCSPARRTVETWEYLAPALDQAPKVKFEKSLYLASRQTLVARLGRLAERTRGVMVIGHNPGLQDLALLLTARARPSARARMAAKFPTAALAWFIVESDWSNLDPDTTPLKDYVVPADLGAGDDAG